MGLRMGNNDPRCATCGSPVTEYRENPEWNIKYAPLRGRLPICLRCDRMCLECQCPRHSTPEGLTFDD